MINSKYFTDGIWVFFKNTKLILLTVLKINKIFSQSKYWLIIRSYDLFWYSLTKFSPLFLEVLV